VLKVTAHLAAPGAESAVCDCRVLLIQKVRRNDSWLWDYLIGYLVLEFLYWLRSAFANMCFTFFSDIKKTFFEMTCQKVVKVVSKSLVLNPSK